MIRPRLRSTLAPLHAAALVLAAGCGSPGDGADPADAARRGPMEFPVEIQTVTTGEVEYSIRAVGSVEAFETVSVTARVAGVVERVRFQEGDTVTPDRVLAEIEPERFRLAVESADAELAKAVAAEGEARSGLERRQAVNARNPDLVRAEEVDSWRTRLASAQAEVARARSAADLARLNQRDAMVRAPLAGIIQSRDIETGRYVQPGTVIATLVRRDPLLLRFRVPETDAAPLAAGMPVRFSLRGGRDTVYRARITLVAAAADPRDRMVGVTAEIDDPARGDLRPGAFAEIEVPVGGVHASPVIPQAAIRPSDRGFLAFVVEDGVARERVLELGLRTGDGRVEVKSGVTAGEQLVVRGAEALADGARVVVREGPTP